MRQDSVLLAFGSYPWICENVARAACTLWSRASWGEPWFPHCAFVASGSQIVVWHFVLCFLLLFYQSLRWYNVIISSCIFQLSMNWSAVHLLFFVQVSSRLSCQGVVLDGADRLPVVVRFSAGPRVSLKTVDPPKGNGLAGKASKILTPPAQ